MIDLKEYAMKELESTRKMIALIGDIKTPPGHLERRQLKNEVRYYHRETKGGRNGSRQVLTLKEALGIKALRYKVALLDGLKNNEKVLSLIASSYQPCDPDSILASIPEVYRPSIEELTNLDFSKDLFFYNTSYPKTKRYKSPIIVTDRVNTLPFDSPQLTTLGCVVRSKSEAIIGSIFEAKGIPYIYNRMILLETADGQKVYRSPDFIIICPDGFIFCWEHLGYLKDSSYSFSNELKLNLYAINNITPMNNLIITSDDLYGSIDASNIARLIDCLVLPHFKK